MARRIEVEIVGDARSLQRAFDKSSRSAKGFQGDMQKTSTKTRKGFGAMGRGLGLVTGAIGLAGLAGAVKAFAGEALAAQKVAAQTDAVIKSTGGSANVTAKQVDALADSILRKSGIDDEATKNAQNQLLTFAKIRNETGKGNKVFDRATEAVADLATTLSQGSVPSAEKMHGISIMLGKALNDPVKGLGALGRAGVQFTKAQKDSIKEMVKSGNVLGAQKIILSEIEKMYGGASEAAGKTFAGQMSILRETVLNLGGAIATKLMPAVQRLLGQLVKWLNNSRNQQKIIDAVTTAGNALKTVLDALTGAFRVLSTLVGGNRNAIIALVVAFAAFKALQMASTLARMAQTFGILTGATRTNTAATRTATAANRAFTLSLVGKAGLVVGAGVAAFALTTLVLKLTGLDKKLATVGGHLFDFAAKLGLVNDPMAEFAGKANVTPGMIRSLRGQATRLRRRGVVDPAAELARRHPNLARRDIEVAIGARRPQQVQVNVGVDRQANLVPRVEQQMTKRHRGRPQRRRGAR